MNVRDLERFDAGTEVTPELLKEAGLVRNLKPRRQGPRPRRPVREAGGLRARVLEERGREDRGRRRHVTWLKPPHEPKKRRHKKGPAAPASEAAAGEVEEAAPETTDEPGEEPSE